MNNSAFPPTQPTPSPSSSSLSAAAVSSSSPSSSSITVTKTATISSSNVLPSSVVGASVTKSSNKLPVKKKCANDFKFIGLIGEGSFSMVALAVDIHNKQKYAIKICEKRQLVKENKAKAIMTEKKILELLDLHSSPYLIRLHFSFQDSYRLFFGLSFARGGELLTYINKVSGFNEECTRFYSAQILLALEYLHKLGIIHRDLKPENLLLNERLHIQVTDFGSAFFGTIEAIKPNNCDFSQGKKLPSARSKELVRNGGINNEQKNGDTEEEEDDREHRESFKTIKTTVNDVNDVNNVRDESERQQIINRHQENIDLHRRNGRSNSFVGTAQYVSPEMLRNKNSSTSSDLWAYGCIVYQMLVGNPPFNDATDFLIFQKILAVNLNFPEKKINPEWRDLIESLLILDPCKRLGATDDFTLGSYPSIRAHPFFTEFSQPTKVTSPSRMQKSPLFSSSSTSTSSTPPISSSPSTNTTTSVQKDTITVVSPRSPSYSCTGSDLLNQTTTSSSTQTRWSTLYLEESPLIRYLSEEDYLLESRISCLDYDDIEPGLHEGLLLGLGLSDNPKKSDLTLEKVDSTSSSSSVTPSQRTDGNNSIPTTSNNRSGNNYNSKNDNSISSLQKENSRSNNPERVKKKGLFGLKWFKH